MKVAIVDDEKQIREEFKANLKRYGQENGVSFSISEFSDGDGITANYTADYDFILMDIEMAFVNGMDAATEIRELDSDVTIIFITNAPQYAIEGYKVGALDYILKPVNYYAFSETISRAISVRKTRAKQDECITVNVKGGIKKLSIGSILYAEVMDHDLYFHTNDEVVQTRGTIREVESELSDFNFFKCNKGCIVNLAYVEGYHQNDVMVGEDTIQVSRARKKALLEALNSYYDGTT